MKNGRTRWRCRRAAESAARTAVSGLRTSRRTPVKRSLLAKSHHAAISRQIHRREGYRHARCSAQDCIAIDQELWFEKKDFVIPVNWPRCFSMRPPEGHLSGERITTARRLIRVAR
jgi:hypothetical protein